MIIFIKNLLQKGTGMFFVKIKSIIAKEAGKDKPY
jgi:hypothetical protein